MADNITILAQYFGVDKDVIKKCVEMTKRDIVDISTTDIYACVMDSVGLSLPEEIVSEVFSQIPLTDFLKICTLTEKHAKECEKPSYWLKYLKNRSKDDWIKVIKHLSPSHEDADDSDMLSELSYRYRKRFKSTWAQFILSVVDSYTLIELEFIIDAEDDSGDDDDYGFIQNNKIENIKRSTGDNVAGKLFNSSWVMIGFLGKYLKSVQLDKPKKVSDSKRRDIIAKISFVRNSDVTEQIFERALARYFTSMDQLIQIYKNLKYDKTSEEIAKIVIREGVFINQQLAKSIASTEPKALEYLSKNFPKTYDQVSKLL